MVVQWILRNEKKLRIAGHNSMNLEFSQDMCLKGDMLSSPLDRKFYAAISIKGCIQFAYTSLKFITHVV